MVTALILLLGIMRWCWGQDSNLRGITPVAYKATAVGRLATPAS
jgi:hypothetical protein